MQDSYDDTPLPPLYKNRKTWYIGGTPSKRDDAILSKQVNSTDAQYRKMTETPVSRLIVSLGIPTTISMLITNIYNMADSYFVSKISLSAGGATSVVFGLMAILQAFGFMFGHGAGSNISRMLGSMKSPISKFVIVLDQIAKQKGEAPEA